MSVDWESGVRSAGRLLALAESGIVDLGPDDAFDRLLELAVTITGAPRGCITFVNGERTVAISATGFPEGMPLYAPIEHSFCRLVVGTGAPFMVEDATRDPRTIGDPAIAAFAAVAWIGYAIDDGDGHILGTFCLMDSEPHEWTSTDIRTVATLARAASTEITLRKLRMVQMERAGARQAGM